MTLAMCAHAWLAVTAAANRPPAGAAPGVGPVLATGPERGHQPVDNDPRA